MPRARRNVVEDVRPAAAQDPFGVLENLFSSVNSIVFYAQGAALQSDEHLTGDIGGFALGGVGVELLLDLPNAGGTEFELGLGGFEGIADAGLTGKAGDADAKPGQLLVGEVAEEPAQLGALREHVRMKAQRMAGGECPMASLGHVDEPAPASQPPPRDGAM